MTQLGDAYTLEWSVLEGDGLYIRYHLLEHNLLAFRNAEAEEPGMCVNNEAELQLEAPGLSSVQQVSDTVSFTVTCCGVGTAATDDSSCWGRSLLSLFQLFFSIFLY